MFLREGGERSGNWSAELRGRSATTPHRLGRRADYCRRLDLEGLATLWLHFSPILAVTSRYQRVSSDMCSDARNPLQ